MKAKEWIFKNYPEQKEDWGETNHDDEFMCRMMEEYKKHDKQEINLKCGFSYDTAQDIIYFLTELGFSVDATKEENKEWIINANKNKTK